MGVAGGEGDHILKAWNVDHALILFGSALYHSANGPAYSESYIQLYPTALK